MKHQGEYGFTYDSEAEEWAAWCASVLEHDRPQTDKLWCRHVAMTSDYTYEAAKIARHSPAQPQNTAETGQPTGWDTIALLCLQGAAIAIGATLVAGMVGWL